MRRNVLLLPLILLWTGVLGCKAKTTDPQGVDGADLSTPATCEQMRCVDPEAVCCDGEPCVDTRTNPQHCGACGKACPSQEICAGGTCVCRGGGRDQSCGGGTSCCPDRPAFTGGCKNLQTDTSNCGSCGRSCRDKETCAEGSCRCNAGPGCTGPQTCCPMGCANLQTDASNCGTCGKRCPEGKACKGGICEGECTGCAVGETCCNGKCTNTLNDADNCGMCGKKCPMVIILPPICFLGNCVEIGGDGGISLPDGFQLDM